MDERSYGDLVALCQFLPVLPAVKSVWGWIITGRAFRSYYFMDWIHFTVCPCFSFFASFLNQFDLGSAGWIHGLKLVAVAIVAHAIWGMAQS